MPNVFAQMDAQDSGTPSGVPAALGGITFHLFTDAALHDIGTGDGIIQGGPPETRTMVRTRPLADLSRRTIFLHDGSAKTLADSVQRHGGQAAGSRALFNALTPDQRRQVIAFLGSL